MKVIFSYALVASGVLAGLASGARGQPATEDPDLVDLDGDGDIDADDRAILDAAEVISIEDASAGRQLSESGRAVTVVDLARARERTADLGEVLSRTQGVQVRRAGGLGSETRFSLNGLYDEQIRFFLDGVPIKLAGFGLGVANVPVDLVQRVDVYRGVVPIALGADALGGAVDLVTDPSWVDRAAISYQIGSFGAHRVAASSRVRDDDTGLALGLALFTDRAKNDYPIDVDIPDASGRLTRTEVRRFHDAYLAGGAIVEGGVVQRGIVERALVRAYQTTYDKELQHNLVMSVPYGDVTYAGTSRGASGDVVLAGERWRARLVLGGARETTDFRDIGTGVYDWYGRVVRERNVPGELDGLASDQRITERGLFARATAEHALGAHQRLRLAVAPTAARRRGRDHLPSNRDGRDPLAARRELIQVVTGVEHELALGGLHNIAFVKHYHSELDAEEARFNGGFDPVSASVDRFGAGDSVRYRLARGVLAKASYEWATRLPSVDELFGDGVLIQENPGLAPEVSHNANLGVAVSRDNRLGAWTGEVSGFGRLADNLIHQIGGDRRFTYQNVYAVRALGVEGSGGWTSPRRWASLEGSLTVQDVRNASTEGPFAAFEGDRLPNRPWLLGSLSGALRTRDLLRPLDELSLFASSRYVHGFFRGWDSAGRAEFRLGVDGQLVHGVGVTYALRGAAPVVTTLEMSNVTDERVYDSYGVQRPGRAVYLKVSAEM